MSRLLKTQALSAVVVLFSAGCSTTIKSDAWLLEQAATEERAALADAVSRVAETRWAKPSSSSFAERLTGTDLKDRISRKDAAGEYVKTLMASNDAEAALMSDARDHLAAAEDLKGATEAARASPRPRLADVALVEDAISDLRETRSIYLASLEEIDGADENEKALRRAFDAILRELGDAADALAERAMEQSSGNFAGSEPVRTAGSL